MSSARFWLEQDMEKLQRQLAQAKAVIAEQKNSIAGLNSCIGGEDSFTTDNLIRVTRLENIIKEQKEMIDSLNALAKFDHETVESALKHIDEQSELIEKLADVLKCVDGGHTEHGWLGEIGKIEVWRVDEALAAYNSWKENK